MKKLTVLITLSALLIFTMGAAAQDVSMEDMKMVGGVSYNTFDSNFSDKTIDDFEIGLDGGLGFYIGGQYWFNEDMAVEAGYDFAKSSTDQSDIKQFPVNNDVDNTLKGPYGKFVYNVNEMVNLNGGLAYYSNKLEDDDTILEANGVGFLVGADVNYPINEQISFVGSGNYRMAKLDVDKDEGKIAGQSFDGPEIDMSGLRISGGISYKF